MRSIKNLYAIAGTSAATISLALAGTAHAVDYEPIATGSFTSEGSSLQIAGGGNINTANNFSEQFTAIANNVLNIVLLVAGVVAVFYLIFSGFQYLTAGGNAEKTKGARTGIINAVIGIIIILAAFFIVRLAVGAGGQVTEAVPGASADFGE